MSLIAFNVSKTIENNGHVHIYIYNIYNGLWSKLGVTSSHCQLQKQF